VSVEAYEASELIKASDEYISTVSMGARLGFGGVVDPDGQARRGSVSKKGRRSMHRKGKGPNYK